MAPRLLLPLQGRFEGRSENPADWTGSVHISSITASQTTRHGAYPRAGGIVRVADTVLNVADQDALVTRIAEDATAGTGGTVFTLNLDHLVKLRENADFRIAYERARYVTADGAPVVWMARAAGAAIERVTGADLVVPLCAAAAARGLPVHLFGTSEAILARAAARLQADLPDLVVAGRESPAFGFVPDSEAASEAAGRIATSGARICFVALGAPKQELFADLAALQAPDVTFVCVGAALDFLAGAQVRAPRAVQVVGLEWAWRLAHDPRRLSDRYRRSAAYLARYVATGGWSLARRLGKALITGIARDFNPPDDKRS